MMNKHEILKKIGSILQDLGEQYEYLNRTEKINILELELFTANADFLIDHIEILKKMNDSVDEKQNISQLNAAYINNDKLVEEEVFVKEENIETTEPEITSLEEEQKAPSTSDFSFDFKEEPTEMVFDFEKEIPVEEVFDRKLTPEEQDVIARTQPIVEEAVPEISAVENNEEIQSTIVLEKIPEEQPQPVVHQMIPEPEIPLVKKEEQQEVIIQQEIQYNAPAKESVTEQSIPVTISESEIRQETLDSKVSSVNEELNQAAVNLEQQSIINHQNLAVEEIKQPVMQATNQTTEPEKKMSLNELLSAQRNNNANAPTHSRPIVTDLKVAINLNDKMIFIRELFNGYNLAYSEAIEILNRFDSFEAADNFLLKNYAEKNNWAQKQSVVDRFYEILNRKFKA